MMNNYINGSLWKGKKVFVTGHTGFKGSWLCLWLHALGAEVTGYALKPPTQPSLFEDARIGDLVNSVIGDVENLALLQETVKSAKPDLVIHMAAQPLVRESYNIPVETYRTNVMGTVHLFEAVRQCKTVRAVINVTTDKCYDNKEWVWGYRETDPLGGYDPYSNSKACSEMVTSSYRSSFFNPRDYATHGVAIASARAGNVIGGGDWAKDRLVPDCICSLLKQENIHIRNPHSIRPWQHVLEPLSGYLLLGQKLLQEGLLYGEGWNFGPNDADAQPVQWIVEKICNKWQGDTSYVIDQGNHPHEATYLKLDCSKAKSILGWQPRWSLEQALDKIVNWAKVYQANGNIRDVCLTQIEEYSK